MTDELRSPLVSPRETARRVGELLALRPDLTSGYEHAKTVVRAFRRPAFYEVSQRCNLFCEGCYFFEDGRSHNVPEPETAAWEAFFAAEGERRVSMAYFVGAETALHQDRLMAAAGHIRWGVLGTNGTIPIDRAIPFRISVSVWAADEETDIRLRGAPAFRKALKNFAGDPRAIVLFTVSPWNLAGARTLAEMCRDHGLPLTFNMYSPTGTFLDRLSRGDGNDKQYFRVSRPDSTPCFSDADLAETRRVIDGLVEDFPETVIYSRAYNAWATQPGPLYDIDPATGMAPFCGSRIVGNLRYYTADLQRADVKCCTPDIDCSSCRMYSGGWSSKFQPSPRDLADEAAFSDWLGMMKTLGDFLLYDGRGQVEAETSLAVAV